MKYFLFLLFFIIFFLPITTFADISLTHVGSIKDNQITELYGVHAITIVGDYAYIAALFDDGVSIIDISDPASPTHVGSITDDDVTLLAGAYDIVVVGDYAYVTSKDDDGLEILDVSDPTSPTHVGSLVDDKTTYTNPRNDMSEMANLAVVGDYAYVGQYYGGLEIIDVSDPTNPIRISSVLSDVSDLSFTPWDVKIVGDYAYVASMNSGLSIIDISDPANPFHVSSVLYEDIDFRGLDTIEISGDYAFMLGKNDNGISL